MVTGNPLPIKVDRIVHTIHAVSDLPAARLRYQDLFGGLVFAEGYEPSADRDMALLYAADHMIEPMAPRDCAALDKAFARWLSRFGEGWHSFEIKIGDAPAAAAAMEAAGLRLLKAPYPVFFFVRAESTGGVLVEACEVPMPNDPYDRRSWNPAGGVGHASGLLRLDHIACVVPAIAPALGFFTEIIDGEVLADAPIARPQPARRVVIRVGDTKVALVEPAVREEGPLGVFLARPNTGVYALVWQVESLERARAWFAKNDVDVTTDGCLGGDFAIDFRGARHEFQEGLAPA